MVWHDLLSPEFEKLSDSLYNRARDERTKGWRICPGQESIFRALELTPPDKVKAVIIGQDPYHTPGQANGLAFSTSRGHKIQPSLINIYEELNADLGLPVPDHGDLTAWAERGVLLLNTTLTVYERQPNSHVDWGWNILTHEILRQASLLPQPAVFLVWGKNAIENVSDIRFPENKLVLKSTHPSPYSYAKASRNAIAFKGSRPFSRTNDFLAANGIAPIDWSLE